MSKSFTVASAKGGVGKTTTTANLGAALAAAGHDVVLVDADIGMANLGAMLGIVPEGPTLHDVLSGDANLEEALYDGPCGMRVVPGSVELEAYAGVDPAKLREVVETLSEFDGYVLVDSSAGLSHDSSLPLALGDGTLLVSTPDRASLLDTEKTRELTSRLGGSVLGVALTRVEPDHPMLQSAPEVLGADVIGEIPEDEAVTAAAAAQEPLEVHAPQSPAAVSYRELARELTGEAIPEPEPETEPESVAISGGGSEPEDESVSDSGEEAEEGVVAPGPEQEAASDAEPEDLELDEELEEETDESEDLELDEEPENPEPDTRADEEGSEDEIELEEPIREAGSGKNDESAAAETTAESNEEEPAESGGELAEPIPDAEPSDAQEDSPDADEESDENEHDEGDGETAEDEADDEEAEEPEEPEEPEESDEADEEKEEKSGFFSRLFGR